MKPILIISVTAVLAASRTLIAASAPSAPPPPHAQLTTAAATHDFRHDTAVLEAESGEGNWMRIDEGGTAAIRAVEGASMRYRLYFPEPGWYFVHMRSHHAVGLKNAQGEVLAPHSTNDAHVLVGGAPLYGSDLVTRPEGMRCHSAEFRWWQLPKGPGGHTPPAIKENPVRAYIPAAGIYEVTIRYRSAGLVIDKLAFTRKPAAPSETAAETRVGASR